MLKENMANVKCLYFIFERVAQAPITEYMSAPNDKLACIGFYDFVQTMCKKNHMKAENYDLYLAGLYDISTMEIQSVKPSFIVNGANALNYLISNNVFDDDIEDLTDKENLENE